MLSVMLRGKIDQVGIAQHVIILKLARGRPPAHAAPFVMQGRIQIGAAANRVGDHLAEPIAIGHEGGPGQELALLERPQLLGRHAGLAEAPDMLDDIEPVA